MCNAFRRLLSKYDVTSQDCAAQMMMTTSSLIANGGYCQSKVKKKSCLSLSSSSQVFGAVPIVDPCKLTAGNAFTGSTATDTVTLIENAEEVELKLARLLRHHNLGASWHSFYFTPNHVWIQSLGLPTSLLSSLKGKREVFGRRRLIF
jgi:hypothetical protein